MRSVKNNKSGLIKSGLAASALLLARHGRVLLHGRWPDPVAFALNKRLANLLNSLM